MYVAVWEDYPRVLKVLEYKQLEAVFRFISLFLLCSAVFISFFLM